MEEHSGFLRLPQVMELVPLAKSTIWRRVKEGTFPRPVKLSERVTAWSRASIIKFCEQLDERAKKND